MRLPPVRIYKRARPMVVREQSTDRRGRPLAPGTRVRVVAEQGQPEGSVVRVLSEYGAVTVLLEKPAKAERMYPINEVEAL